MLEPLKSISTSLEHNIYYQTLNNSQEEAVSISTTLITDSGAPLDLTLDLLIEDLRQSLACHPVLARLAVDFVCHDAYSPNRAPELWTQDVFAQYFERLKARNGRVLTYSTAAAVGGGLRAAGFHVYRSAGLGRKSGGTVASVAPLGEFPSQTGIRTLTGEEETILASRSGLPYRDPALQETRDSVTRQRALAQAASSRAPRPARSLRQETRPRVPAEDTGPDGPSF